MNAAISVPVSLFCEPVLEAYGMRVGGSDIAGQETPADSPRYVLVNRLEPQDRLAWET